jgi:hypothetical protein
MRPIQRSATERSGRRRAFFLSSKQDSNNNEFDLRAYATDRAAQPGRDSPGDQLVRHEGVTKWFHFGGYWRRFLEADAWDY